MTSNTYSRTDQGRRAVGSDSGGKRLDENGKYAELPQGAKRGILPRVTVLAALVAILIGLGTGTAVALYSVNAVTNAGTITSGDLWISVGEMTWEQVTPGMPTPTSGATNSTSGVLNGTPVGFQSMPGDIIEIRVPVTTYLKGDNLIGDMTIDCSGAASSASLISASFHIENAGGIQVQPTNADVDIDTPLTVHGLLGGDAGTTANWIVVIRVKVLGDYQWVTPDSPDPGVSWTAGAVDATLKQVRSQASDPSGDAT